jgi:hypothetical protein
MPLKMPMESMGCIQVTRRLHVQKAASHLDAVGSSDPWEVDPETQLALNGGQQGLGSVPKSMADLTLFRTFCAHHTQRLGQSRQLRQDEIGCEP